MTLSPEQAISRERTLRAALLLSMWGPLATGFAMVLGRSTTQLADLVRRSVELLALLISWWAFRRLERGTRAPTAAERDRLERLADHIVAATMVCSALVMLSIALSRLHSFQPGGKVYLGLAIALLGLITNLWFWRRYSMLTRQHYSAIIATQSRLYRAKAGVDLCVLAALAAVAISPAHPLTRYVDLAGSVVVAGYLLWSAMCTLRRRPRVAASEDTTGRLTASVTAVKEPL